MGGLDELNFNGDYTWPAQEQGRIDGTNALMGVHSANVKDFIEEWVTDSFVQAKNAKVGDYINARVVE